MPCNCLPSVYKGPCVIIIIGSIFSILGAIPVAVTLAMGSKHISVIIGMGFVGFGMLLMLPGLCWCIIINYKQYSPCSKRNIRARAEERTRMEKIREAKLLEYREASEHADMNAQIEPEEVKIIDDTDR